MEQKQFGQKGRRGPINPFTDWGFKYIFGREEHKDLLKAVLKVAKKVAKKASPKAGRRGSWRLPGR